MTERRAKVFVFTGYGMGETADAELRIILARKFLGLLADADPLPSQICFYTDGVRLCAEGSPVLPELQALEQRGVELVLCATCLDRFGLHDKVAVGIVGGMGDIITALTAAGSAMTL